MKFFYETKVGDVGSVERKLLIINYNIIFLN